MNICIITEYFPETTEIEIRGGVEARAYHIARELAKKHTVFVITSSEHTNVRQYKLGKINVLVCSRLSYTHSAAFFSRLRFAWNAYRCRKQLQDKKIHIVDGYNFISYLPAYFLAKKLSAKKVATYHEVWLGAWIRNKGVFTGMFGAVWEWIVLQCNWDKIIAVSEFTRQKLAHYFPDAKLAVVQNGVVLDEYASAKTMKKNQRPTICCISRLTEQKRVIDLIEALPRIKQKISDIQCIIIGVGKEQGKLTQRVKELNLSANVTFLGFVKKHRDVVKVLTQSTVLCLPSVVEGFGMVILEAMAAGIPYVCTNIPPLKEITGNGKGGLLAQQKNPDHLAAQLLLILRDKKLAEKKRTEGLQFVRRYAWEQQAARLAVIYGEVARS